jgi:hypothetical protein
MRQMFVLSHDMARQRAVEAIRTAPPGYQVTVGEQKRSGDQNARLWASLSDVSQQVDWHGKRLTPEDWKHVFSSSLKKLQVVPNLDGSGFVALGMSTSRMSKRELSDMLELIYAFGAERGVRFQDEMEAA